MAASRREFFERSIGVFAGVTLGSGVGALLASCRPGSHRLVSVDVRTLTTDGQGMITATLGSDGAAVMIVRVNASRYVALSTQCTHEGCPVNAPVDRVITCPCHGSRYDLEGRVLQGPAVYPLTNYPARYRARIGSISVDTGSA